MWSYTTAGAGRFTASAGVAPTRQGETRVNAPQGRPCKPGRGSYRAGRGALWGVARPSLRFNSWKAKPSVPAPSHCEARRDQGEGRGCAPMSQRQGAAAAALRRPQSSVSVLAWLRFRVRGHPGKRNKGRRTLCPPFNCVSLPQPETPLSRSPRQRRKLCPTTWLERSGTGLGRGLEQLT